MNIALRRHIFSFPIGTTTFKLPEHETVFAALNQVEGSLLRLEKTYPSDAFECNLVPTAGAAPFLIIKRMLNGHFLFTIGTIAGFGASLFIMVENEVFRNRYLVYPSFPVSGKGRCLRQVVVPFVGFFFVPLLQLLLTDFKLVVEQVDETAISSSQIIPYGGGCAPVYICAYVINVLALRPIKEVQFGSQPLFSLTVIRDKISFLTGKIHCINRQIAAQPHIGRPK